MGQTLESMSYIKEIALKNYRSFVDARCRLSPFTLIVGANNAGKSNLLKAFADLSMWVSLHGDVDDWSERRHHASKSYDVEIHTDWDDAGRSTTRMATDEEMKEVRKRLEAALDGPHSLKPAPGAKHKGFKGTLSVFAFDPAKIGNPEGGDGSPHIQSNGVGVSWVLDQWYSGAKAGRDRFAQVVADLRRCVPEIDALSFYHAPGGKRGIQVEQFGLPNPVPLSEVSDGTRLVLAILTLINLENPPPVILLEDINRGLHPRLYERIVEFLRTIANEGKTQILATTHDPYLIDEFDENPEAVVIVDKQNAASTLSNLDDRLRTFLAPGEELEMPLGQVWFSGLVGGVPAMKIPAILKPAQP